MDKCELGGQGSTIGDVDTSSKQSVNNYRRLQVSNGYSDRTELCKNQPDAKAQQRKFKNLHRRDNRSLFY